ncbi:methionyl-tRNA formyltransferase, partial [Candidatus Peregrinibacteria bacterium]|nr:methionyl-tRNA formyltransferase [Candidatus Peregrinibacteria bacterium]
MKIIFFGTPEFSVPALEALALIPSVEIVKVITQPDKKIGRKQVLTPPAIKVAAERLNLKTAQPSSKKELEKELEGEDVDFFIVIAYGMVLSKTILSIPDKGSINIHASLLPKYRGASPIQEALLNGDNETGVSIMKIDEKLDHGPVYTLKRVMIEESDTIESLTNKLSIEGARLLPPILKDIYEESLRPIAQKESTATHCRKIKKTDGEIDFNKSAEEIFNMIRAYTPWPSVFTT